MALVALERALTLAKPEGYLRVFVDEGLPMAQLLSATARQGVMSAYARRLLAMFALGKVKGEDKSNLPIAASVQPLVESLSEREIEVLQLIAQGLSNDEISQRLVVALSTVKGHNLRIFGKLQVQRRMVAVARARELGWL